MATVYSFFEERMLKITYVTHARDDAKIITALQDVAAKCARSF
jgi:hypothetical protein